LNRLFEDDHRQREQQHEFQLDMRPGAGTHLQTRPRMAGWRRPNDYEHEPVTFEFPRAPQESLPPQPITLRARLNFDDPPGNEAGPFVDSDS